MSQGVAANPVSQPREVITPAFDRLLANFGVAVEFLDDAVHDGVEEFVAGADVLVQRHRLDIQLARDRPHRRRADTLRVDQLEGDPRDEVPREPPTRTPDRCRTSTSTASHNTYRASCEQQAR